MGDKERAREELARLTAKYLQNGGVIQRDGGTRVILVCPRCRAYRYLQIAHAAQFKPKCRCGNGMKIVC